MMLLQEVTSRHLARVPLLNLVLADDGFIVTFCSTVAFTSIRFTLFCFYLKSKSRTSKVALLSFPVHDFFCACNQNYGDSRPNIISKFRVCSNGE